MCEYTPSIVNPEYDDLYSMPHQFRFEQALEYIDVHCIVYTPSTILVLPWTHRMVTPMDNNIKLPAPHFFKIIKDEENAGNKIVSERTKRNGSKVIIFKDGGKLVFKKSGFLTREFSDGKKIIYSPIGKRQVVCPTCTPHKGRGVVCPFPLIILHWLAVL